MSAPESDAAMRISRRGSGSWATLPGSASPTASREPTVTADPIEKIEGRWTLQILLCLNGGEHRFSDLRAAIPRVSANIMTDRLRALESVGLVQRHRLAPPHASQVYMLAECAAGLRPALDELARWRVDAGRALDAMTIIDALGTLNYEEKKA